jgi:anti-sigma factor (TIGR02949 family)
MRCREVVELMTEYLEGALSDAERLRFEQHLQGCDGCRAYLEQLRRTRQLVGKLADEPVPEHLRTELMKAFRDWRAR